MKYFAILKDSFREAVDSKVMYTLFALSTVAVLIVGTVSFKPLSARTTMEQFFPNPKLKNICIMFAALHHPELTSAGLEEEEIKAKIKKGDDITEKMQPLFEYRLEKVDLLRGEEDAPESDYVLTLVEVFPSASKKEQEAAVLEKTAARVRIIFQKAHDFGLIRIGDITSELEWQGNAEMPLARSRHRVTLHGTPRTVRIWAHEPSFFFGALPIEILTAPLSFQLFVLAQNIMSFGAWIAILLGVVITSFFIPSMLSKGTVDMLLVKPIRRWALLLYKYVGGLTFIFLNTLYAITGMWLMLGLRTGVWPHGIVLLVLTMTFFFAILYAISTFVGVATRSTIAAIITTLAVWALCAGIGVTHKYFESKLRAEIRQEKREEKPAQPGERWGDSSVAKATRVLNAITPRTEELNIVNDRIVYYSLISDVTDMRRFDTGERPMWESLLVSTLWIIGFLGAACLWFSFKDY